ncbi:hypothetical protein DPMN_048883 [Dreissena polymorpha]|uniref:Uncharacterized protein n=1 Tax=Dreissena polymorpha TaxID=45954 RepID=A0A9D4I2T0_DREPO|nr:hypothetical protein DPMN_048883 [Dreissena polymorpha]
MPFDKTTSVYVLLLSLSLIFILFKETGYIVEPYPANDIAILRLEHSAFLSNYNRPVCLPSPLLPVSGVSHVTSVSTVYDANVGAECYVTGHGATEDKLDRRS